MKKIVLLLSCIFISVLSNAQCVPDSSITHNTPGIYPDSATGLPQSHVGVAYSTDIHFNVKSDTVVGGLPAHIDLIEITDVLGLPSGFSYTCTPANCNFPSATNSCIQILGLAPNASMVGIYPITVQLTVHGTVSGFPTTVPDSNNDYSIVIDSTTGISKLEKIAFSSGQNQPNPATGITSIPVTLTHSGEITLTVSNLIGKKVFSKKYTLQRGKSNITVDVREFEPGIYLYSVSDGSVSKTRRMIVSND